MPLGLSPSWPQIVAGTALAVATSWASYSVGYQAAQPIASEMAREAEPVIVYVPQLVEVPQACPEPARRTMPKGAPVPMTGGARY